jgi:hypothetical protein
MSRIDPIREAQAAKSLRESIAALDADDALLLDTIEGETNLFETIDAVLARMAHDQAHVKGCEAVIEDLGARKTRFEHRIKSDRALIEQALLIAEIDTKVERPAGTLSLAKRAPVLVVETEAEIPVQYWKAGAPTLDKKTLTEALRARRAALDALAAIDDPEAKAAAIAALPPEIPGATLSNAAPSLTIRTK